MGEQTYHRPESSKRSGVGDQASQGVLLARPVDYMSVVSHHDWHLLHHLDSSLAPTAKRQRRGWMRIRRWRRKRRGVQLTGFVSLWEWRRRLAAFKSPSGAGPRPLRGGGAGGVRGQYNTPVCFSLSLSVTLDVCDKGGWVCFFFLSTEWVPLPLSLSLLYLGGFFILFPAAGKNKDRAVFTHLRCVYVCVWG